MVRTTADDWNRKMESEDIAERARRAGNYKLAAQTLATGAVNSGMSAAERQEAQADALSGLEFDAGGSRKKLGQIAQVQASLFSGQSGLDEQAPAVSRVPRQSDYDKRIGRADSVINQAQNLATYRQNADPIAGASIGQGSALLAPPVQPSLTSNSALAPMTTALSAVTGPKQKKPTALEYANGGRVQGRDPLYGGIMDDPMSWDKPSKVSPPLRPMTEADRRLPELNYVPKSYRTAAVNMRAGLDDVRQQVQMTMPFLRYGDGGPVRGPKGLDKVPIMATEGEYVLPVDTTQQIGKPALDQLVAKTHTPVRGKVPMNGYANGDYVMTPEERRRMQAIDPRYAVAVDPESYGPQMGWQPDFAGQVPLVGLPDPNRAAAIQAREAQKGGQNNRQLLLERFRTGEGMSTSDVAKSMAISAGAVKGAMPTIPDQPVTVPVVPSVASSTVELAAPPPPAQVQDVARQGLEYAPGWEKTITPGQPGAVYTGPRGSFVRYAGPGTGGASPLGIDAATMNAANANIRRGGGGGSFSVIGGAPGGVSDADYAQMSLPEKSAARVKFTENSIAAVRSLRNARREAEGLPRIGEPQLALKDQIALVNLQRGIGKDQRAAAQDDFMNRIRVDERLEGRQKATGAAQDRYLEQAVPFAQKMVTDFPWMGEDAGTFFQRAAAIKPDNPARAVSMLAGTMQAIAGDDKTLLFELGGEKITPSLAVRLLNGENVFSSWLGAVGPGKDFYTKARQQAAQAVQAMALRELAQ